MTKGQKTNKRAFVEPTLKKEASLVEVTLCGSPPSPVNCGPL